VPVRGGRGPFPLPGEVGFVVLVLDLNELVSVLVPRSPCAVLSDCATSVVISV